MCRGNTAILGTSTGQRLNRTSNLLCFHVTGFSQYVVPWSQPPWAGTRGLGGVVLDGGVELLTVNLSALLEKK